MANLATAFGGRPVRYVSNEPYNGAANLYYSAGASALYVGDPVVVDGSSNSAQYFDNAPGTLPTVVLATAGVAGTGTALTGFVIGFYAEDFSSKTYGVNSAVRGVWVADDPRLVFEIADDGLNALPYTAVQGTGILNLTAFTGSTATGLSGATLSTAGFPINTATSTYFGLDQLKVLRLSQRSNNALGLNAVWDCMIVRHTNSNIALGY